MWRVWNDSDEISSAKTSIMLTPYYNDPCPFIYLFIYLFISKDHDSFLSNSQTLKYFKELWNPKLC